MEPGERRRQKLGWYAKILRDANKPGTVLMTTLGGRPADVLQEAMRNKRSGGERHRKGKKGKAAEGR